MVVIGGDSLGERGTHPASLLQSMGPLLEVLVTKLGVRGGQQDLGKVPLQRCVGLIDTGASHTCVDERVLKGLGLQPVDKVASHTPHGVGERLVYPCTLQIPGHPAVDLPRCLAVDLDSQGIEVLIGRDFLQQKILIYDGTRGNWTIAW